MSRVCHVLSPADLALVRRDRDLPGLWRLLDAEAFATAIAPLLRTTIISVDPTYVRYLTKALRDHLPFRDVAIKLYLRNKRRDDAESEASRRPAPKRTRPRSKKKQKEVGELWNV